MGGAYYGLSDDEYALFYNPAGLSLYRGTGQGMLALTGQVTRHGIANIYKVSGALEGTSDIGTLLDRLGYLQGEDIYANVSVFPYFAKKNFAIGLLLADTKANFAFLGREFDSSVDITVISDSGLLIGYGRSIFHPRFHWGLNTKLLLRAGGRKEFSLVDIAQGSGVSLSPNTIGGMGTGLDFDLGFMYELPEIPSVPSMEHSRIGLTFTNLLATQFTGHRQNNGPPPLTRTVSLGSIWVFSGRKFIDNFILAFDLAEFRIGSPNPLHLGDRDGSFWKHVNLGLEMPIHGWLRPRMGLHQGYFTAGVTFDFRYGKLDFAWYETELSSGAGRLGNRRFAVRLAMGVGSAPPAPFLRNPPPEPPADTMEEDVRETQTPAPVFPQDSAQEPYNN